MRTNRTITQSHARPAPRRRNRGSALIEAVVALVLFSAGIVGLIGLQARMVTAQSDAKYRADAVYLVSELVGAMWADRPNLASYATAQCASLTRCKDWSDKVAATLPSGSAAVTVNNGIVTVTLTWTPPNYGTHTYSASTAIRF
jgi:type IV pilus assembly protein PilV